MDAAWRAWLESIMPSWDEYRHERYGHVFGVRGRESRDGWNVGTDGHVLGMVPVSADELESDPKGLAGLADRIVHEVVDLDREAVVLDRKRLVEWCPDHPEICPECEGTTERRCLECDGTGEVDCECPDCYDQHVRDCDECDGTGGGYCRACEGEGVVPTGRVKGARCAFGGVMFNLRLLSKVLAGLPNSVATVEARECSFEHGGILGLSFVGSDGGHLAQASIMGLRLTRGASYHLEDCPARVAVASD